MIKKRTHKPIILATLCGISVTALATTGSSGDVTVVEPDFTTYACFDPKNTEKRFIFDDSFESFKKKAITVTLEQNILNEKDAKVATLTLSSSKQLPEGGFFDISLPLSGDIEYTQPITQYLYVKKDSSNEWGLYLSQANTPADIINRIKNNPIILNYVVTDKPIKRPLDPTTLAKTAFKGQDLLVMNFSRENPDPDGNLGLQTNSENAIFIKAKDNSGNVIPHTFSILQPLTLSYPSTGQQTVYLNPNSQVKQINTTQIDEPHSNASKVFNYGTKGEVGQLEWVTPIENQPFSLFTLEKATCSYYSELTLGAEVPAPTSQPTQPANPTTPKWKIKSAIKWGPNEVPVNLEKAKTANQPIATLPIPYQGNERPKTYAELNPTLSGVDNSDFAISPDSTVEQIKIELKQLAQTATAGSKSLTVTIDGDSHPYTVTLQDNTVTPPTGNLTWLSKTGATATASAASCVTDNTSGLTWELKSTNSTYPTTSTYVDRHDPYNTFRWADIITTGETTTVVGSPRYADCFGGPKKTFGVADNSSLFCHTHNFEMQVNKENKGNFCGKGKKWRLPSSEELTTLIAASEKSENKALKDRLQPLRAEAWKYWTNNNTGAPQYYTEVYDLRNGKPFNIQYDPAKAAKIILVNGTLPPQQ